MRLTPDFEMDPLLKVLPIILLLSKWLKRLSSRGTDNQSKLYVISNNILPLGDAADGST